MLPKLVDILGDEEKARLVVAAAKASMGYTISEFDLKSLTRFAERVAHLAEFRESLQDYLHDKCVLIPVPSPTSFPSELPRNSPVTT